ncbi:MAG: pyridoxal phosphate-dependent aminotransferase [Clostridiales bacterium]|nr:pyridoxal phosphate-dependent aminotransferase [Clostridiales bacterium]
MIFNQQICNVEPSKSVTLLARTKELQKTDKEIINLTGGEPDFPTPAPICDEVTRQLAAGNTHYTDSRGNEDLRIRIAVKLNEENDAPYTKDQILVTPGAKLAVYLAVRALINPGDEAIWLTPGWVSYPSIVEVSGGVPVAVHLKYEEDYRITAEALEAAASERTKLLILNYPNNPTGRILTDSDIEAVSAFLRNHPDVYVLSDEIYEKIIYDGRQTVSMASFPEFFDRVIVVNGFSKCSAMTGWRVGYLACNSQLYPVILKLFQHAMSCTSGFLQKGALVALDCKEDTERMRQAYERRRDLLVNGMRTIPGVDFVCPQGAFYAWVRFDTDLTSGELCDDLLERAKIAGVPGEAYGEEDAVCVRFSFAAADRDLQRMLVNLRKYMESLIS